MTGSPCGEDAGARGIDDEDEDDGREGAPVEGAHAVKHLWEKLDGRGAAGESHNESDHDLVTQLTGELGIRIALGARRVEVMRPSLAD